MTDMVFSYTAADGTKKSFIARWDIVPRMEDWIETPDGSLKIIGILWSQNLHKASIVLSPATKPPLPKTQSGWGRIWDILAS